MPKISFWLYLLGSYHVPDSCFDILQYIFTSVLQDGYCETKRFKCILALLGIQIASGRISIPVHCSSCLLESIALLCSFCSIMPSSLFSMSYHVSLDINHSVICKGISCTMVLTVLKQISFVLDDFNIISLLHILLLPFLEPSEWSKHE